MPRYSQSSKHRRPVAWPWLVTWMLGMGGLVTLTAWRQVPLVEQHLLDDVQQAVRPIVSAPVTVSIDGRDATIAGPAADADERDALLAAVADVPGVRAVTDQLTVPDIAAARPADPPADSLETPEPGASDADPSAPEPTAPALIVEQRVEEDVPPAGAAGPIGDELLATAEGIVDDSPSGTNGPEDIDVRDDDRPVDASATIALPQLSAVDADGAVDESAGFDDLAGIGVDDAIDDIVADLDDDAETRADVMTAPAREPIEGAGDMPLPSLSLALVDQALTLRGRIGADQDLSELVRPALAAFDPSYLTNRIDTTAPTATADWIEPVAALMPHLAELQDAALDITDRRITLAGTAPSRGSHDRLVDQALTAFTDYAVIERIEIDTSTPAAEPLIDTGTSASLTGLDTTASIEADGDAGAALPPAIRQVRATASPLRQALDALDGDPLVFESGSDVLTGDSAGRLDQLADLFKAHAGVIVEIEGHTDSTGPAELNLSLSQQRASAVKRALVERGLGAERLVAYGYGEGVPVADNATAEGRARNRRIEFRF